MSYINKIDKFLKNDFLGFIRDIPGREDLYMLNQSTTKASRGRIAEWYEQNGSRQTAKATLPGTESSIVEHLGRTRRTAAPVDIKEKKVFPAELMNDLAAARAGNDDAAAVIRDYVASETRDLRNRVDNEIERQFSSALQGGNVTVYYSDLNGGGTSTYASNVPSANIQATVGTSWASSSSDIMGDLSVAKKKVMDAGMGTPVVAMNSTTFKYFLGNDGINKFLTDTRKNEIFETGKYNGMLGFRELKVYDETFTHPSTGVTTNYIPDNVVHVYAPDILWKLECMPDDYPLPSPTFTGLFGKTWETEDPATLNYRIAWSGLAVLAKPSAAYVFSNVTAT